MSKWSKTRRDPGRTYRDEEEAKLLRDTMKRIRELVEEAAVGNEEAEPEYVRIINKLEPGMTKERRKELIKQFRDAVADHQRQRDQ
jgi:TPP-dependent pyruvate/acetoin dehydrogenase alpha subunit